MRRVQFLFPSATLLLLAVVMVACGTPTPTNYLQSLTVSPSTANGNVHFAATGKRINGQTVSPVSALWWNVEPWFNGPTPSPAFTIDSNGNATCLSISGVNTFNTFPVWATAPVNPNFPVSQMTVSTPQVVAMAQITCP